VTKPGHYTICLCLQQISSLNLNNAQSFAVCEHRDNSKLAKHTLQIEQQRVPSESSESSGALSHGSSRDVSATYSARIGPLFAAFKVLALSTGVPDSPGHHCIMLCLLEKTST